MKRILIALAVASAAVSISAQRGAPPNEPLALVHANVVNVRDGRITPDATLVLRNGRIESIAAAPAPSGVRVLDLRGKYVLPGLIDAHTHADNFAAFRRALESGVTTVRSAGVSNYADVGFHELVKKGAVVGPDVVTAGYHVRPQLAPEAFLNNPEYADLMSGVTTIEKMRRAVQMNLAHGVDWIKILATERAGTADTDPRKQVYTEEEIRAIVQEAATRNVPVEAHAHGDEGAMAAVRAGVRSIEHGTYLSDATLQLMKERGTYFDPTYTTVIDLAEPGGDYDEPALMIRGQQMLPRLRSAVERAHKLGLKIVTGGDTGYGPKSLTRISQEVGHFVEMGFTPLEALQSATIVNAEMLRLDKSIGVLEPGYEADLIAVERNPLQDIVTVQDPLLVISNGRIGLDRLDFARTKQAPAPVANAQQAFAQANDYVKQQQYDKALTAFDEAIALEPKNAEFHLGKCRALAAASRHKEAIPACSESLRLRPDYAEALRDRGHYYLNLGQVEPALADLTKAAGLVKTDRGVYYHLGVAYYLKGDFGRAATAYQSCLDNSTGADTIECIAWLYPSLRRAGRNQEAAAVLDRVQVDPRVTGHPAWYLDRLLLFKGARTEEQVAANLTAEGELSMSSIGYSLGLWHLLNGRTQRAREYFEKAVATNFTPAWGYRCSEAELKRIH